MIYSVKKLATICDVRSGYTARAGLKPGYGGVPAIQFRDLSGEEDFDPSAAPTYPLEPSSVERYRAGAGDVLFRSRGERNTAVVIAPESRATAVAVLPLIILRPNRDVVDPRYLAWFINQPTTQRYFDAHAYGSAMRMIAKVGIDGLPVELPNLATQRLIVEIDALARREHALTQALATKKLDLTNSVLLAKLRQSSSTHSGASAQTRK